MMSVDSSIQRQPAVALAALEDTLRASAGMLVAFSGGVDSAVLLAVATRVLHDRAVAFTADSPSMPRRELAAAIDFARRIGARHIVRETTELERDEYRQNDRNRCYWCKHTLFGECETAAAEQGLPEIAYGYTADDVNDYRPGHRAAGEFGVRSPLLEAGLSKVEIRGIARSFRFDLWDKPAAPCLSSRIPYGSPVSETKLAHIDAMEELLHDLGFRVCRARYDGVEMRIEVERGELSRAAEPQIQAAIEARANALGIRSLTLDPDGFQSGRLNAVTGA
jgi:uncharacterized protein